jgi:hypothetical protein
MNDILNTAAIFKTSVNGTLGERGNVTKEGENKRLSHRRQNPQGTSNTIRNESILSLNIKRPNTSAMNNTNIQAT